MTLSKNITEQRSSSFLRIFLIMFLLTGLFFHFDDHASAQTPDLPEGLEMSPNDSHNNSPDEPALPIFESNNSNTSSGAPALPIMDTPFNSNEFDDDQDDPEEDTYLESESPLPWEKWGFFEIRAGIRTGNDSNELSESILESRLQMSFEKPFDSGAVFRVTGDLVADGVDRKRSTDLEEGRGIFDLREFYYSTSLNSHTDLKLGRQILTWGTGDMLFINDLFPKDWNSFFIGRDDEYLKAPSDSIKLAFYTNGWNTDLIYTPRFDPDRFIDGRRISWWNDMTSGRTGMNNIVDPILPEDTFSDSETAVRFHRTIDSDEFAVYFYNGFWKSPGGMDSKVFRPVFPDLKAYGLSFRGTRGKGILNLELGYYDSKDDSSGKNPFVKNSELRFLAGYEQEIGDQLTLGLQYYLEYMQDYDEYKQFMMPGETLRDELRHVLTARLTKQMWNQNLTLSLFGYYSPSDRDSYFRPKLNYKVNDTLQIECGGNFFFGEEDNTFFGQFEQNSNVFAGLRYSF